MNQANQGNDPDATPDIPVKRKRGRPRKDRSANSSGSARVPPGFGGVNGTPRNLHCQMDPVDDSNDGMVGQAVTGVIEVAFDAGYLLTVRIGDSNTCLRGVVFKPGHYVPISAENDIAPQTQMIRRNNIHLPSEGQTRVRGHNKRSRERKDHQYVNIHGNETALVLNGSPPANQARRGSKVKHFSPVLAPAVPPVGARGTVVPVILQPVTSSNGLAPVSQVPQFVLQPTHIAASGGTRFQMLTGPVVPLQHGTNQNGPSQVGVGPGEVAKTTNLTGTPGDSGPEETIERVRLSSQLMEAPMDNSRGTSELSAEDSDRNPERANTNMIEPLLIEPLQAIHSDVHNQSILARNVMDKSGIGRMTELLQAVQENMVNNQEPRVVNTHIRTIPGLHKASSAETSIGNDETVHSNLGHQV